MKIVFSLISFVCVCVCVCVCMYVCVHLLVSGEGHFFVSFIVCTTSQLQTISTLNLISYADIA